MSDSLKADFILKLQDQVTGDWKRINAQITGQASGMGALFKGLGPLIATAFSVHALKDFAASAMAQEKASARLAQALANAGDVSLDTRKEMEDFSSSLQKVTTFGDESVTEVQAMIVAMTGLTGKAVQPLTVAALDLASGLNMDAQSVAQLIGKTLAGQDALGRYGISTKNARTEQEKLNAIVDQAREKFGGFARAEAQTVAGQFKQLENAVDDFKEALGFILLDSSDAGLPKLIRIIQDATELVPVFAKVFEGLNEAIMGLVLGIPTLVQEFLVMVGVFDENNRVLRDPHDWFVLMGEAIDKVIHPIQSLADENDRLGASFMPVTDGLGSANDALTEFTGKMEGLKARGVTFISEEQEKRVQTVIDGLAWLRKFKQNSAATQNELIISNLELQRSKLVLDKMQEVKAVKTEISNQDLFASFARDQATAITAIQTISSVLVFSMNSAWRATFGEANSLFEQFAQQMTTYFTQNLLQEIGDGILSLLPGGGIISAIGGFLGFHSGGTVPRAHDGALVNASPSSEFLVMVRGGETIRTEDQERSLQRGSGSTILVNQTFYGSSPSMARLVVDALKEAVRQTNMPVDQLVVNKRSNIVLAST